MKEKILNVIIDSFTFEPENFIGIDRIEILYDGWSLDLLSENLTNKEDNIVEIIKKNDLETLIWKPKNDLQFLIINREDVLDRESIFFEIYELDKEFSMIINWQGDFVIITKSKYIIEFYQKAKENTER